MRDQVLWLDERTWSFNWLTGADLELVNEAVSANWPHHWITSGIGRYLAENGPTSFTVWCWYSYVLLTVLRCRITKLHCMRQYMSQYFIVNLLHELSEGFSAGAVVRNVGFSGSSVWKTGLSCQARQTCLSHTGIREPNLSQSVAWI